MSTKVFLRVAAALCCSTAVRPAGAQQPAADTPPFIPEVLVIESVDRRDFADITPGESAAPVADAMEILTRMPGANVNRNGPLSGQAQYRGLYGPRMTVSVDDMRVTPGGPNWMDAPLHYMPAGLTDRVVMTRGIAPVSAGPGIGGLIQAESKKSEFVSEENLQFTGDAVLALMSNNGDALSGFVAGSNSAHRFHAFASSEDGNDMESATGDIGATAYGRETFGGGYGFRWGGGELDLDFSHTDTDHSGTPSLPLDIDFFDTDRINIAFATRLNGIDLSFRVFRTAIEHGMNNYALRVTPDFSQLPLPPFQGDDKRFVDVDAKATGFVAAATISAGNGELNVGFDGNYASHTAVVEDPDSAPFFVNNFNDSEQDQLGLFAEWFGDIDDRWSMELGLRLTRIESDTGDVDAFPARLADMNPEMFPMGTPPFAVRVLRERFNAANRAKTDDNVDAVLEFDYRVSETVRLGFGYARKTRSPMYIERYLWIPLEVNSGLGDLNNYVGNVDLEPEESDQLEFSLDWAFDNGFVSPRLFYRSVDDYIQGVASTDPIVIAVSANANGDPSPLRFENVEAELYGFDLVARYRFSEQLRLDGTINYARGKRADVDDDLYRIAPLNARVALTFEADDWSVTAESVLVAEQDKLSRTIVLDEPRSSNEATPGYGLLNLYGQWQPQANWRVRVGVENLLDKDYVNHLAGFNRVTNSSAPLGARVPGPGLNAFGQVQYSW